MFVVCVAALEVWEGKVKLMFCDMLRNIRRSTALFKGSQTLPICPDKNSSKMKKVWSIGGMIVTGEN